MIIGTTCAAVILERILPDQWWLLVGMVGGFFFAQRQAGNGGK
jgi:hypothetical protein